MENKKPALKDLERVSSKSGWCDSNTRPPHPKCGAITGLRYTPKTILSPKERILVSFPLILSYPAEREGFEPSVRCNTYDSLANCSFRPLRHLSEWVCKDKENNFISASNFVKLPLKYFLHSLKVLNYNTLQNKIS